MNKTEVIASCLNRAIKDSDEYKNYCQSYKDLKKHSELFELEQELKRLQQQILKERTKADGDSYELEMLYKKQLANFNEHPLIVNYLSDKEELVCLVEHIQTYIQGLLDAHLQE